MTHRFGPGEYYVGGWSDDVDQVTFTLRELFVDILQDEARNAYADFHERVKATVHAVFDAHGDQEALTALLEQSGLAWNWPPPDDSEWPPYGEGFLGPAPIPPETFDMPLSDIVRPFGRWNRCWPFHGWLLRTLLEKDLDSWSEDRNLGGENPWVASHLLARICKSHLTSHDGRGPSDETKLDHRVFPSRGVLAWFEDSLGEFFDLPGDRHDDSRPRQPFRSWDPTQEQWSDWSQEAGKRFENALKHHRAAVEAAAKSRGLKKTPDKRKVERDLRLLVRFQVLRETLQSLRKKGEHIRTTQRSVERAADLVELRRRTV